MSSKTVPEQVAFDMAVDDLKELLRKCPEDFRKELFYSIADEFCLECWTTLEPNEVCYCWNDE